jgi:hypothetical protein
MQWKSDLEVGLITKTDLEKVMTYLYVVKLFAYFSVFTLFDLSEAYDIIN